MRRLADAGGSSHQLASIAAPPIASRIQNSGSDAGAAFGAHAGARRASAPTSRGRLAAQVGLGLVEKVDAELEQHLLAFENLRAGRRAPAR